MHYGIKYIKLISSVLDLIIQTYVPLSTEAIHHPVTLPMAQRDTHDSVRPGANGTTTVTAKLYNKLN
jgi:hypothetical protein